ncbi:MAG: response regulator [Acetobacter sp.]|jgi:CheY-like chemotaxis protein|nr:response regulator [Acetobacter sp.]MCH4062721.1 response regulator [Acetobacter sp.]MCH4088433.1 response regulator [Acetobacter sp.]MCI1294426.1 response regulator [Acetobacter sp.]MCI1321103.1 response regulator [Acetobacter sp.]
MAESPHASLIKALPYARRYARALTGSQSGGDMLVAQSFRDISLDHKSDLSPRNQLYSVISKRVAADASATGTCVSDLTDRCILLLTILEDVSLHDAPHIFDISESEVTERLKRAEKKLKSASGTSVLIIEDEPIIAMDIEDQMLQCGHTVTGVAHTQEEAISMARISPPGLILADINLGNNGNGIRAVNEILENSNAPVIFVTAYPESLLTGEQIEPAFVITKPFDPVALAIAAWQASTAGQIPIP